MSRLHGVFGAETRPSYADGQVDATTPFNPKQVIYEVFGPAVLWLTSATLMSILSRSKSMEHRCRGR